MCGSYTQDLCPAKFCHNAVPWGKGYVCSHNAPSGRRSAIHITNPMLQMCQDISRQNIQWLLSECSATPPQPRMCWRWIQNRAGHRGCLINSTKQSPDGVILEKGAFGRQIALDDLMHFSLDKLQGCLEISIRAADQPITGGTVDLEITDKHVKCSQSLRAYNFGIVCPICFP